MKTVTINYTDDCLVTIVATSKIKIYTPLKLSNCNYRIRGIQNALCDILHELKVDTENVELIIPKDKSQQWYLSAEMADYIAGCLSSIFVEKPHSDNWKYGLPDSLYGIDIKVDIDK